MVRTSRGFAKCIFVSVVGALALLLFPLALRAQTIHVPADQPNIQSAINAASNGDTVLVAPGTYIENINFNGKAITVTSSGGPSVTIIDGGAKGAVVTFNNFETTSAVLNGFTIQNGSTPQGYAAGSGIFAGVGASPTISGNRIVNNSGCGAVAAAWAPVIQGNLISGNGSGCSSGGGGIWVGGASGAQILNNTISNNSVQGGDGGGIEIFSTQVVLVQGNIISGNLASAPGSKGGGIAIEVGGIAANPLIVQNLIFGNAADQGAGIAVVTNSGAQGSLVVNNTIANNDARQSSGSGIFVDAAGTQTAFINNIVVGKLGQTTVFCGSAISAGTAPTFQSNNVLSPQANPYSGVCSDQTGMNGNISSDPLFMSVANNDFHLQLGSPAIDTGTTAVPNPPNIATLPQTDFDGNPRTRIVGTVFAIDEGAYELVHTSSAAITPNTLSFGSQAVGTTSSPLLTVLTSTGATPFQITSIQMSGDFTQATTCPVVALPGSAPGVPNGSSCGFNVFFTPVANGQRSGLLTANGTNGTSLLVSLSGTGFTPAPAVSLSTTSLSFSPRLVGTTSAPLPVTMTNTGNAGLNISSITASQPFAQTNNCPALLAAAANCTINVTFQPTVSGNATGALTIMDSASGSPHIVGLSGTGNPVPQPVAITLVRHISKDAGTTTSTSLAFPSSNTAGNWIAVAIRAGHSGQSFSVRDSNGNTYHQAVQFNVTTDAPNGDTLGIFYAENIIAGANQVTVSDTRPGTMRIAVLEYSGVASSSSLNAVAVAQGNGSAPNSGSIVTSANGDLLVGAVLTGNGENFTAGPGYLIEERVPAEPGTKLIVEDQVQPASGMASASVSLGAADSWGAAIAAFKSATTSVSTSPTIASLNPASGVPGTSVTITGTNFGSTQGTSTVTFNGGVAATPTSWSAASIVVPVPAGTTTGNVVITVGGVASNGVSFAVMAPTITSLSPSSGTIGTPVTIVGTGFGATQGTSVVYIGGIGATPTNWSATSITITVPNLAATGNVVVAVGGLVSNGLPFTVVPTPNIASLSVGSGAIGSTVAISGTNFGATQGVSTVTFNGLSAGVVPGWSDTSIFVTVPVGATSGNIVVTVGGVASNGVNFFVTDLPVIASLAPTTGPVGTSVTITGTHFGTLRGTSVVTFSGVLGTPTTWSDTSITLPVPQGAPSGPVTVTIPGFTSNGVNFTVTAPPPSITSLNPTSGLVSNSVTITGTNFLSPQGAPGVSFNGIPSAASSWTSTSITTFVPNGATTGPVVVTVSGVASNGVNFTVIPPPAIIGVSPPSAPVGVPVTIMGSNFGTTQGSSKVSFNGTTAVPTSWSDTSIQVPVPSGAASGNVVVTVAGVGSNGLNFTVLPSPPSITSLNPTSGGVLNYVTISGANFGASRGSSTVTFNGTPDNPNFSSWNSVSITTLVPAGATTGNVVVTVGGQSSNAMLFTVTKPTPSITSLNPTSGLAGTPVTITGTNFTAIQGTSTVTFNGTLATPTSWSTGNITVPVPTGATSGNTVVTIGGVASNGVPFTVNSAAPSIALVQHASKDATTASSSTLSFSANNTAGNFIGVVIRAGKSGQVFSVSDSRGNIYKQAIQFNMTVDAETLGIFYAENIAGGANTVTVSDTILGTMRFAILEYSGVATSNSLDVSVATEGTSASPATNTVTTNFSGDLLLGEVVTANPATFTAGNGYTIEERVPAEPNTKLVVEDQRQSIAGAASAGASLGASDGWGVLLVAFRHP